MAPANRLKRKRVIDNRDGAANKFLLDYYNRRGIPESPEDDKELLTDCTLRAEEARENFKRMRPAADDDDDGHDDGADVASLTSAQKYQRRLKNNRRSAAAARVHAEVLRKEHCHALRCAEDEKQRLAEQVGSLKDELERLRKDNARLTQDRKASDVGSVVASDEASDEASVGGGGVGEGLSAGFEEKKVEVELLDMPADSAAEAVVPAEALPFVSGLFSGLPSGLGFSQSQSGSQVLDNLAAVLPCRVSEDFSDLFMPPLNSSQSQNLQSQSMSQTV